MCIKGGYILQPRVIDGSEVSKFPPHVREIWLYLLRKANFIDLQTNGKTIKRGQLLTTYSEIIEGLSWKVGFRKESYKTHQVETAMKTLTKAVMITKARTTRGIIVTICKYDYYQTPKNYDNHSESHNENHNESHNENHPISKKENNNKNSNNNNKLKNPTLVIIKDVKKYFISDTEYFTKKADQLKVPEHFLLNQARVFLKYQKEKGKEWENLQDLKVNFISWFKILQKNRVNGILN